MWIGGLSDQNNNVPDPYGLSTPMVILFIPFDFPQSDQEKLLSQDPSLRFWTRLREDRFSEDFRNLHEAYQFLTRKYGSKKTNITNYDQQSSEDANIAEMLMALKRKSFRTV